MDLYTHQQQQQQTTQQIDPDSMASGSPSVSVTSTPVSTSTTNSTPHTTSNLTYNINNKNSTTTITNLKAGRISPTTSSSAVSTADADTVAIAKDMLQLHQSAGTINNNSRNSNNNTNTSNAPAAAVIVTAGETIDTTTNSINNITATTAAVATTTITTAAAPPSPATTTERTTPHVLSGCGMDVTTTDTTNHNHQSANVGKYNSSPPPPLSSTCQNSGANINVSSTGYAAQQTDNNSPFGILKYEGDVLHINGQCTVIGRNSSTSIVQFHVGENNLVSRKHFQLLYDAGTRDFYVQCLSKNGIFVDDFLQRRNADPLKLPPSCYFRFPSTDIRIQFENLMQTQAQIGSSNSGGDIAYAFNNNHRHHHGLLHNNSNILSNNQTSNGNNAHIIISPAPPEEHQLLHSTHHSQNPHSISASNALVSSQILPMDSSNIYSPLKISIPKKEQKSPYLSPTGTISAANSCPASPRQGIYQNQMNYNNYGNNNLQNDHFQTPSTVNYNINEKPPYSYAQLIVQAISAAPDKQLTLSGIYSFIVKHYPYYRKETNKGWQNSIRHNLSLNRYFIKVARSQDEPGKGSFWRIDPESGAKLIDHSYKKRRQRSSQGFRPSYGMPRSAPVSPSHMDYTADNSRESSPLQDIVLQSAPGSPGISIENRAVESDLIYSSQTIHQSATNNTLVQYNSGSPSFTSNPSSVIGGAQQQSHAESGGGGGGSGGVINSLKRNNAIASGVGIGNFGQQQHQSQSLHPDVIYDEMPTDYSGNIDSGDECDAPKRPKYISEVI